MRKTRSIVLAAALVAFAAGLAPAATYDLDPAHTQVMFKVKHMGIATVTGKFKDFSGTVEFTPGELEQADASATIQTQSVDTGIDDRDNHLRSDDFFSAEKFPEIKFQSTEIRNVEGDEFEVVGDLTIRDVTKQVVLDGTFNGQVVDPWGNERIAFSAEGKINRKEFGLQWNKLLETGGLVVDDEVRMILEVEAIRQKG
ncbi:MAG: hypothetical protein GF346_12500 [Candidatus Eisenbacteria bacterium]|nr:hypothetical protein [Candidatus Latescibacterota bacterium]MBD3303257.1 hypothetical protein [Candidatus Eisenbacteria bacterium]